MYTVRSHFEGKGSNEYVAHNDTWIVECMGEMCVEFSNIQNVNGQALSLRVKNFEYGVTAAD